MSVELISWAFKQPIAHSSAKFVLVVMADASSNEACCAFVSAAFIADATGQDRKTVLANIRRLQDLGYISDTGKRIGKTGQVIVYRLNVHGNDTENGIVEVSQNRNSSGNGTVPETDGKSTENGSKESRFSRKESQKRDTEPLLTVKSNGKSNKKKEPVVLDVILPNWLPPELWDQWVAHRATIKKPLSQAAAVLSIETLADLLAEGHSPKKVIEASILGGWTGLFPLKQQVVKQGAPTQGGNRQQQLEERNRTVGENWTPPGVDGYA